MVYVDHVQLPYFLIMRYRYLFMKIDGVVTTKESRNRVIYDSDGCSNFPIGFDKDCINRINRFVRSHARDSIPIRVICTSQWRYLKDFSSKIKKEGLLVHKSFEPTNGINPVPLCAQISQWLVKNMDTVENWAIIENNILDSRQFYRNDRLVMVEDGINDLHIKKIKKIFGVGTIKKRISVKPKKPTFEALYGLA